MVATIPDAQLTEMSLSGSEGAFDEIVARYQDLLLRHCRRLVGEAQAQDAVQETFLTAWSALRAGVEVQALRPWLFTIAHRKALAALSDRRARWSELPEMLTSGSSSADAAEQSARVHEALAALAQLPPDQREALVGSAVHGRSGRQLARSLGIDEASVRQLVHRARANVRSAAAACVLPPVLLSRWAQRATNALRRIPTAVGPAQAEAGARLAKVAAGLLGAAIIGTTALQVAAASDHAARPANARTVRSAREPALRERISGATRTHRGHAVATSERPLPAVAPRNIASSLAASANAEGGPATASVTPRSDPVKLPGLLATGGSSPASSVAGTVGTAAEVTGSVTQPIVSVVPHVVTTVTGTVTGAVSAVGATGASGVAGLIPSG